MLGKESKVFISLVPLSNNTIINQINKMANNINEIVLEKIKYYFHWK